MPRLNPHLLTFLTGGLLLLGLVYQLLPVLACYLDLRLAAAIRLQRIDLRQGWQKFLPPRLRQLLVGRLVRAGYRDGGALLRYVLILAIPAPFLALVFLANRGTAARGYLLGLVLTAVANGWLSRHIRQRRQAFQLCLYKLYRFLDLQLSAGIKATDVLKGLTDAVADPLIKPEFQRFCASYELTLDLDQALLELESAFPGPDLSLLASQLRQCLQTGIVGHTFMRMEELMFSRHLALIQARTRQYKTMLLFVSLLALVPVLILFIYPLVAQAREAVQTIFGP